MSKGATAKKKSPYEIEREEREERERKYVPILTLLGRRLAESPGNAIRTIEQRHGDRTVFKDWVLQNVLGGLFEMLNVDPMELYELALDTAKPKPADKPKDSPGVAIAKKKRAAKRKVATPTKRKRVPAKFPGQAFSYEKVNAKPKDALATRLAKKKTAKKPAQAKAPASPARTAANASLDGDLLKLAEEKGEVTAGVVIEELLVGRQAASSALKRLVDAKKLVQSGTRRHTRYTPVGAKPPNQAGLFDGDEDLDEVDNPKAGDDEEE